MLQWEEWINYSECNSSVALQIAHGRTERKTGQFTSFCASEIGLHFKPAWSLPPFILNGASGPQKPHCVSERLSSPEGPSEGASLDPHRYSFSELISCITSLHKYCTGLWSKSTSGSLCLPNCFGSYMCILNVSSTLKLANPNHYENTSHSFSLGY